MKDKHTPGPWRVVVEEEYDDYLVVDKDNHCIADILPLANARLIAAAPDLLEACKDALNSLGYSSRKDATEIKEDYGSEGVRVYNTLVKAIKLAEGTNERV